MIEHDPIEVHQAVNGVVGDESPLLGRACRACSPRELVATLVDGEAIDTGQVTWWPCSHVDAEAPRLEQVHEQIRAALPVPDAACLDNNHRQSRIDYLGDTGQLGELLPQLRELAARHGWIEGDGSVQLTTDGLRITLSSTFPR